MAQSKILPSEEGLVDIKFDTALNLKMTTKFRDYPHLSDHTLNYKRLLLNSTVNKIRSAAVGVEVIGHVIYGIFLNNKSNPKYDSDFYKFLKVSNMFLELQESHLFNTSDQNLRESLTHLQSKTLPKFKKCPSLIKCFYSAMRECKIIQRVLRKIVNIGSNKIQSDPLGYKEKLSYNSEILGFQINFGVQSDLINCEGSLYLVSRDQLNMILNKIIEIYLTLINTYLLTSTCFSESFHTRAVNILKLMTKHVMKYGNKAYTFFKNMDGLCAGLVLKQEGHFVNDTPFNTIEQSIEEDNICSSRELNNFITFLSAGPTETMELSGLSKLLGHPDINTLMGIDKLRKRTFQPNPVDHKSVELLLASLKYNFIRQYLARHKRWPLVTLSKTTHERIRYCWHHNLWIESKKVPDSISKCSQSDFSSVTLCKVKEFDANLTQFGILKDTSLAYVRSIVENPTIAAIRDQSLKRTLIYFLMTKEPHTKLVEYMDLYAKGDPLCLEYCVIKLTQKERELKIEGRFFGQSPYEERARRCVLESNVSNLMKLYNNDQAMTLTELEKFKKLYQLSRLNSGDSDYYAVYISIDVEAWNKNFRRTYCEPVGEHFFDRIFGTEHFKHVMRTFEASRYLVDDGLIEYTW